MYKLIKLFISSLAFSQIVLGCTLAGDLIGFLIYYLKNDTAGFEIAITTTGIGLIGGIFWAVRITRKEDPADYVSQIRNSSDLNGDNPDFFHRP
jgi:glucose uptake protein GlcU